MLHHLSETMPLRALAISVGALLLPVLAAFFFPETVESDVGVLIWLTALIPAFMLAYYRGLQGVAVAVAVGMVVLVITQVAVLLFGVGTPNWTFLLVMVLVFLLFAVALAVFAEVMLRERREAQELALTDALTGLPNRRYAELFLEKEFAAAMRGRALSVLMFDIDHFKKFNDTHGHAAGDEVLVAFAGVLNVITRRQNVSARLGGEEFISILSDQPLDGALVVAEKVRDLLHGTDLEWGPVTVSIGCAVYQAGMGSYPVLVAAADRALYAAKENGRDRVEVATDEEVRRPSVLLREREATRRDRVFIVDNDQAQRQQLTNLLRRHGYEVEDTGSPETAIKRFGNTDRPIDLLLANVMMQRVGGFTLVDRIRVVEPDVRVVYMSKAMRGSVSWYGAPGLVARFVATPVVEEELLSQVREALDETVPMTEEMRFTAVRE